MDGDLGVMVDGFQALTWLMEHAEQVGVGGSCRECSAFAAALLHGYPPAQWQHLRCATAQAMQQQVDAAAETMRRICP